MDPENLEGAPWLLYVWDLFGPSNITDGFTFQINGLMLQSAASQKTTFSKSRFSAFQSEKCPQCVCSGETWTNTASVCVHDESVEFISDDSSWFNEWTGAVGFLLTTTKTSITHRSTECKWESLQLVSQHKHPRSEKVMKSWWIQTSVWHGPPFCVQHETRAVWNNTEQYILCVFLCWTE